MSQPYSKEIIRHEGREYVLAGSSLVDDSTQVLKSEDEFAVLDRHGDVLDLELTQQGLYSKDTRHLSKCVLRIGGVRPLLLSSRVTQDNSQLIVDLTNPPIRTGESYDLRAESLHLVRTVFVLGGACYQSIVVTNFGEEPARFNLSIDFAADFADIFEVRGKLRNRRGEFIEASVGADSVGLPYKGLDGVRRETRITFHRPPEELSESHAAFALDVDPKECERLEIRIDCLRNHAGQNVLSFPEAARTVSTRNPQHTSHDCEIVTSNVQMNNWLRRSHADLNMLTTQTEHGPFPYAGTPWFSTPFGRDSLITALQTLHFNPELARGVLAYLAAHQAVEVDPVRDAEPGKILHESRKGEMAALGEVPFRQYYGSVDSTPLFVMLAGCYLSATGDEDFIREIWPNILRALAWIDEYGDPDGDGFIEYARKNAEGISNQAWKDSDDSVFHADGTLAEGPIAMAEVQGYVYQAWRQAIRLARTFKDAELAKRCEASAENLRVRFEQAFWCDAIQTYAIALDAQKRACCVRTSNPGHCLYTGIASPARAKRAAAALLEPDMFSGWGVRTVSEREKRYNPMSYHNGTIWPHDNAIAAAGLARYGLNRSAAELTTGLFDASGFFDFHRLPELFCGFERTNGDAPTRYPVACAPQAWAAGSPYMLLTATLGMSVDAIRGHVRFHYPVMPSYLDEIVMKRLRVGRRSVDLRLHRYPDAVGVDVLRREGSVDVHLIT